MATEYEEFQIDWRGQGITVRLGKRCQTCNPFAHICCATSQIDPNTGARPDHAPSTARISRVVSIRRRPWSGCVGGVLLCFPMPGQQLRHARDGQVRQPGQDVCQPCLRINVIHLCRDDEGIHEGRPVAATLRASKKPRLSA